MPATRPVASPPAVRWKTVALPVEHGGWGFLIEPLVLGLVIAPSVAGLALGAAATAGFLVRHPSRLVLLDWRKGARYPRTAIAGRFALGFALLAPALLAAAFALARAPFWPVFVAAAPFAVFALVSDARGRSRDAPAEVAGAVALGGSAAAIALAAGTAAPLAWGAWLLLALRALGSVLYVRARIRLDRGLPSGPGAALVVHSFALAATAALAVVGWAPKLAVAAFAVLLARAAWGLSSRRRIVRPQVVGLREMRYGILLLLLLGLGYRLGL